MYNSSIGMTVYFAVDVSGSMYGEKIEQVNAFIQDLCPFIQDFADDYKLDTFAHVLTFGEGFSWNTGSAESGKNISSFIWKNLSATAKKTETAKALAEIRRSIDIKRKKSEQGIIIILVTDGKSTQSEAKYFDACSALSGTLTGNDRRLAIALEGSDRHELETFTKHAQDVYTLNDMPGMVSRIQSSFEYYGSVSVRKPPAGKNNASGSAANDTAEDNWI